MTDLAAIVARDADELEQLAAAATPGPWVDQEPGENDLGAGTRWVDTHAYEEGPEPVFGPTYQVSAADAAYIAAVSPDVVLGLLADRRALLALLRETRDALEKHLNAACGCLFYECRSCETGEPILARLAALDTEVPA